MKKFFGISLVLIIVLTSFGQVLAYDRDGAISTLQAEYEALGASDAEDRAEDEVDALIETMESDQYDVQVAMENLETQVNALSKTSDRRDRALSALDRAEDDADDFTGMDASEHIGVQGSLAGSLPYAYPDDSFTGAQDRANDSITQVRRIMIAPDRPGSVPSGDIVSDFIPQLIRQLYRFAWVFILIALTVSGVMLVIAHDNDERLTKAKSMIYFSLVGFAFIALSFAIVKAITDIDFFRFI